jgi:hypothetical protein
MCKHVRSLLLAKRIFCNENEAPRPAPPPPRFARYASSSGPPPPLSRGRKKRSVLTTRSASEFYPWRGANWETPLRYPPLATCFFLPSSKEGRQNADRRRTNRRIIGCGARSAERARLSAFHRGTCARTWQSLALLQARLPGTWSSRALPALSCPSPVAAPHAPVVMPASMMPGAARERTANPPAGTAPAPPHGLPPEGVPW